MAPDAFPGDGLGADQAGEGVVGVGEAIVLELLLAGLEVAAAVA